MKTLALMRIFLSVAILIIVSACVYLVHSRDYDILSRFLVTTAWVFAIRIYIPEIVYSYKDFKRIKSQ